MRTAWVFGPTAGSDRHKLAKGRILERVVSGTVGEASGAAGLLFAQAVENT